MTKQRICYAYIPIFIQNEITEHFEQEIKAYGKSLGISNITIIQETIFGESEWPARTLGNLIRNLKPGDQLIVKQLSHMGRNIPEVVTILKTLIDRKIELFSIDGSWSTLEPKTSKNTSTLFQVFSEIIEDFTDQKDYEEDGDEPETTPSSLASQSVLDKLKPEIEALLAMGSSTKFISRRYAIQEKDLIQWIRLQNIGKSKIEDVKLTLQDLEDLKNRDVLVQTDSGDTVLLVKPKKLNL